MSNDNLGPGVATFLNPDGTQYLEAIWQNGMPPNDAELNLSQYLPMEEVRKAVLSSTTSGILGNGVNPQSDYQTDPNWSNYFRLAPLWANVNGWLIPVTGTRTGAPPGAPNNADASNIIALDPPPAGSGDFRIDYVYLEVWKALIAPNPSSTNKPISSGIYKFGNVEGGWSYLADDLVLPSIGFETTKRVQLQYRLRVVKGLIGLTNNPDGFDPVAVRAQGAATTPVAGDLGKFMNMKVYGDPGLWRAGDGTANALGTVDGYVYAVPVAAIFRRNSVLWSGNPSPNLNGGFNRNPTASDRTGIKTFVPVTLAADLSAVATTAVLSSFANIALPAAPSTPVAIQIGDEILTYTSITGPNLNGLVRNSSLIGGTIAKAHKAGTEVKVISWRPDGLYSDQIARTDILDLRHIVNPNGFDYTALLESNLDRLLRGRLRSTWKRSGGSGTQGSFVHYQDALTNSAVSLGVTKLDAPDNIRMVFSDAATIQPIEIIVAPHTSTAPPAADINVSWSLNLNAQVVSQNEGNKFKAGDSFRIDINQLKGGFQAGSTDQVRWLGTGESTSTDPVAVRLRFEGETGDVSPNLYTVTPPQPGPNDALTITFNAGFPTQDNSNTATPRRLYVTAHAVYGAGRGLSRRPDSIHSVSYVTPTPDLLTSQWGLPISNKPAQISWAPLWSKYQNTPLNGMLPVTAEFYGDLGSKTAIVTPFRKMDLPAPLTIDGSVVNIDPTPKNAISSGSVSASTITVGTVGSTVVGDAVVITSLNGQGTYVVRSVTPTTIVLDRPVIAPAGPVTFSVHTGQGLMPLNKNDGTAKWSTTDPLKLFSSTTAPDAASKNIYVTLPRHLVPGWGEVRAPITTSATANFFPGVNYFLRTASAVGVQNDYLAYANGGGGPASFAIFSLEQATTTNVLPYNTSITGANANFWAGMRKFTDSRNMGRQGLELPPFYGISRLIGVYQASDYKANGSLAVNLLRQSMKPGDGPVMWVEIDEDKDSTFIINAKALDLSLAPTAIANFAAGSYIVEAVIFGFDRGSFDLGSPFRMVLTRNGNSNAWTTVGGAPVSATRANNVNKVVSPVAGLLPGPAQTSDQIVVNYSRTVYQGDCWGTQTSNSDLPYGPGPLQSGNAYNVVSVPLDPPTLTRPNQKPLEVLASTSFSTTLGTGRYSASIDLAANVVDFRAVAYEDPNQYPPTSGSADRPMNLMDSFSVLDQINVGTEYLGCTERLPLGALYKDYHFRGQAFSHSGSGLIRSNSIGAGKAAGGLSLGGREQLEAPLDLATSGVASAGDILVHVDGEQNNYSLSVNFRVNRGGSIYVANGPHPGGPVSMQLDPIAVSSNHINILHGRALLVRNAPTSIGASEVSAGEELMLLVLTSVQAAPNLSITEAPLELGTNGTGEGYAAADLYRIEGHPLARGGSKLPDVATIPLTPKG